MLFFDVRSLETEAARVDALMEADDPAWMPGDTRPDGPIQVTGRLSAAGDGRFYLHGAIRGAVHMDCRRCLAPTTVTVESEMATIFSDGTTDDAGDPDVFELADGGRTVDLRPAIREQWLLSAPSFALCRPECRGICAKCGVDLNTGTCSCVPEPDPRWDVLRKVRAEPH